jgi:predicted Zn-dependent protease
MITRVVFQFLVLVALFLATFFALKQLDWVGFFHVEEVSKKTEEKLGTLYWDLIRATNREIKKEKAKKPLEKILRRLIEKNGLNDLNIKLHLVENEQINAFALPGGHMVVFSGLVAGCTKETELMGVIGHELAHISQKHVMKKLIKEVGLNVLISASSGNGGQVILQKSIKTLSSSAYDRGLESEADRLSVEYMLEAEADPNAFAGFLMRYSEKEKEIPEQFFWVSTHPESAQRAASIKEMVKDLEIQSVPVLEDSEWRKLKEVCSE